jgi:hypothetical protein
VVSAWERHLSFGYDLIAALKPSVVVELGTETGLSFFCFCQSMEENGVHGQCYAVDTWAGDEHTGPYGDDVYVDVCRHAATFYPNLASLMRMRFNQAVAHFRDDSIDLLHIDGLHTYEAVSEDFHTWYPKVKPGGIILMHDIHVRWKDFGVWKFWEEVAPRYNSFEFEHGFGLGVIRKPGGQVSSEAMFELMFSEDPEQHKTYRSIYLHITEHVELKRELSRLQENNHPRSAEDDVQAEPDERGTSSGEEHQRHVA